MTAPKTAEKEPFFDPEEPAMIREALRQKWFYIFSFVFAAWGFCLSSAFAQAGAITLFAIVMVLLSVIDFKTMVLPDRILLPFLALSVVLPSFTIGIHPMDSLIGGGFAGGLFAAIFFAFLWIKGQPAMGFGDVKLIAAIGFWVGALNLPLVLLCACFTGFLAFALRRLITGTSMREPMPFGPYLALGGWLVLLYAPILWNLFFTAEEALL